MTGSNYWVVIGPIVFAIAIIVWVVLVIRGARRRKGGAGGTGGAGGEHTRGPVSGGRIEGSPAQANRRDEAPRRD